MLARLKQHRRAVVVLDRAKRALPRDAGIKAQLGLHLAALGRLQRARQVLGQALRADPSAHEAALELGLKTIAIPGSGLDALLHSDRADLAHRIVESGGLIMSPFPSASPETSERRWWRNRIIAAICHGLVVVASEDDGGAWEAQRWARQLERWIIEPSEETD